MKAQSNGLVKYIIGGVAFVALGIVLSNTGDDSSDSNDESPPVTQSSNFSANETGLSTVATLVSRDKERSEQVTNVQGDVTKLGSQVDELMNLVKDGNKKREEEKTTGNGVSAVSPEVDKLAARLDKYAEKTEQLLTQIDGHKMGTPLGSAKTPSTRNPLGSNDYEDAYQVNGSDAITWSYPIDEPLELTDGKFQAKNWTAEKENSGSEVKEGRGNITAEIAADPVYTIPANTTIIGAKLASRIVAEVPKGGAVTNPMGFKLVVPSKVLAANGFRLPYLKEAVMGGYAVGNYSLECARGYITSFTFIFEDGRIQQIGDNNSSGGETGGGNTLAVLTDKANTECVSGKFVSDIPEFVATNGLLGAVSGAAEAYSGAQTTTTTGSDNSSSTSTTGSVAKYIAGQAGRSSTNQAVSIMNQLWNEANSYVVVDINSDVNIEIKRAIAVDYDPNARKVSYDWSLPESDNSRMSNYWK